MGQVLGKGRPMCDVEREKMRKKKELTKKPSKIKPKSMLRQRSKELKMQAMNNAAEARLGEVADLDMGKKKKEEPPPDEPEEEPPVDIGRLDIRVGRQLWGQEHPFDPDYFLLHIHLDSRHPILVVSKLGKHFKWDDIGDDKDILVLHNYKPFVVHGITSEYAILCAVKDDRMEMLCAAEDVDVNSKVMVPGYPRRPDKPYMKPWKNIYETVAPDLRVNELRQVVYKGTPLQVKGLRGQYSYITTTTLTDCPVQIV